MAFKMKGHTLPGINQRGYKDMKDGRSKTSAFQQSEKKKKTYTGKIYENLEAVNTAIKNKDYKKNTTGKYVFNFKGDDGKISTKTLTTK